MFTKKEYQTQNGRRFKRMRADYLVKYQLVGMTGEPLVSNIKDLSAGGIKFWTDQFLPEETLLKVSFLVPPLGLIVEALGRVIRIRRAKEESIYYIAIRFIEMPDESKKAVDDFIEYLAQQPGAKKLIKETPLVKRFGVL